MKTPIIVLSTLAFASILVACAHSPKTVESAQINREPTAAPRLYNLFGFNVPLHNLETVPPEEPIAIASLNEIMMQLFKNEYGSRPVTKDPASGLEVRGTRRGVHPRAHGCAAGVMTISGDLMEEAGIFQRGAKYPVTARFSNGSPKAQADDSFVDTRGFAMKVYNVPGRNLLSDPTRLGEAASQDFTLNSTEPFFSDNAERYAQFMRILTFEAPTLEKAGGAFVKKLFFDGHPIIGTRVAKAFLKIKNHKLTTPLGTEYFSITPFQYGAGPDAPIVKFKVEPCAGKFDVPVQAGDKFYLRTNLKSGLEKSGACFHFKVQSRANNNWTIEDMSTAWDERVAPYIEIARIEFPKQQLMDEGVCEKLVINPWNTLPEHKPVGGINRIRLPTYLMSTQKRRETNKY